MSFLKLFWQSFFLINAVYLIGCSHNHIYSKKDRAFLYFKIGTGHLEKGHPELALASLLDAERLDPRNHLIQNNLGLAYLLKGKLLLAEKHFRKALAIKPKYTEARNNLGRTLIEQGAYNEAIQQIKIGLQDLTYPFPERLYFDLGLAYFLKNKYKKALQAFEKALEHKPQNCGPQLYLGRSYFELKQYQKASVALDQALSFCQKNEREEAAYYAALSYFHLGQREESLTRLEELLTKYPKGLFSKRAKDMIAIIK
ncbi:MAG: tetratricopeptide repeat protein [Bdellovibrio sp.]|nr:MAG: tetratricopeptide repeat protein [Bdellovibrio sp.]